MKLRLDKWNEVLAKVFKKAGVTRVKLARLAGVNADIFTEWQNGVEPGSRSISKVVRALNEILDKQDQLRVDDLFQL